MFLPTQVVYHPFPHLRHLGTRDMTAGGAMFDARACPTDPANMNGQAGAAGCESIGVAPPRARPRLTSVEACEAYARRLCSQREGAVVKV